MMGRPSSPAPRTRMERVDRVVVVVDDIAMECLCCDARMDSQDVSLFEKGKAM